jgi:NAD-dependent DNA ligase
MWVLDSYRQGKLVEASRYPPKLRTALHKVTKNVSEQTQQEPIATTAAKSSLFLQGTVFVLCRISPPHYAVDFESNQLEALIRRHGGSLLSSKVVQILQNDKAKNTITNSNNKTRRSCYVICWGGATLSNAQFQTHFAQVQKQDLCDIFAATPIWLQTCVSEQRLIPLHRHPELFLPYDDNKPMHRFPSRKRKKNFDNEEQDTTADCSSVSIRISVTGWSGTKRTAIIHLIEAMGPGAYDDAMRTNTTHLICKEPPSGAKYEKAMEWNIPVVSVEWLYHVAKHGYLPGSEEQFSV